MFKKLTSLAALVAAFALAIPVASWADDTTPTPQQPSGGRLAHIQERISKIEARLASAQQRIADLEQKIADRCTGSQPTPTATPTATPGSGDGQTAAPSRADRCARAQARLERAKDRLQKAQDRLDKVKARIQQWLQNHGQNHGGQTGGDTGSSFSSADQQALDGLQQQLAGLSS